MTHEAALPVLFLQELLVVVAAAAASSELGVDKGLGVIGGFVFWGLTTLKLDPNTLNETSFGGIQYHHDGINSHDSRVKKWSPSKQPASRARSLLESW